MNPYYPNLFKPFKIKKVTFRNRIFAAPSMMSHMTYSGRADQSMVAYYAEKARGGAAVVTLGDTPVDREHAATNPRSFAITPENMPLLAEIALAIHEGGAVASHELNHGGRVATAECNFGDESWEAWGPSNEVRRGVKVHAMTPEEMDQVADSYAEKAEMLKNAGYDMCLIHGGHGWLLDQFLSPLYNTRTDEYGGSLENRAKFPLMVIDRVRQRCGEDFLIEYRMSGSEEIEGGLTKEESVRFAQMIDGKVDIIHVSAGMDTEPEQAVRTHPTSFLPHGVNVHYAEAVKAAGVKTLVATIGGISDPEMAEEILASGKADIIAMSRALIADPFLPKKAAHGKAKEIIPCLRCLDCLGGLHQGRNLTCAVNCHTAQENRHRSVIRPAQETRKVLVVGGGPGGLKAAETAARRGHQVTLAEASGELGGTLKFTDKDELKEDLKRLKDHLIYMAEQSGAEVLLNTTVTPDFIRAGGYDAVVLAVGASPAKPPIPGLDSPGVLHALEVYDREGELGKHVVMLGGGLVGCETALFLAHRGHTVTIVEMGNDTATDTHWMYKEGMRQAFLGQPITTLLNTRALKVEPGKGVTVQGPDGEELIPADSVVYALGMKPNEETVNELQEVCIDTIPVGDCLNPRKARDAMREGFWAVVNLE